MLDGLLTEIIISWVDSFFPIRARNTSYILAHFSSTSLWNYRDRFDLWMLQQNFEQGFAE
jgi:hypothetical protein